MENQDSSSRSVNTRLEGGKPKNLPTITCRVIVPRHCAEREKAVCRASSVRKLPTGCPWYLYCLSSAVCSIIRVKSVCSYRIAHTGHSPSRDPHRQMGKQELTRSRVEQAAPHGSASDRSPHSVRILPRPTCPRPPRAPARLSTCDRPPPPFPTSPHLPPRPLNPPRTRTHPPRSSSSASPSLPLTPLSLSLSLW